MPAELSKAHIGGWSRIYRTRFKEFRAGPATAKNGTLRVLADFRHPKQRAARTGRKR
ncbi:hypothetical protein [Massilia sp. BSC265]|uniref:hypothetical protein n=1 Tax=Massilia sp. BSC265 TaxID=1549812 RepID=UPI000AA897FB|nr:hypothetical protein [Massilia sp. BSC265]